MQVQVGAASYKQTKFENFINAQTEKEKLVWANSLPAMLAVITEIIKNHPRKDKERWQTNTLPKLRELYASARKRAAAKEMFGYNSSQSAIEEMCSLINSWGQGAGIWVTINKTMDPKYYGKAAIAKEFHLSCLVDDKETTLNNALELLKERIEEIEKDRPRKQEEARKERAALNERKRELEANPVAYDGDSVNVLGLELEPSVIEEMMRSMRLYKQIDMKFGPDNNTVVIYTDPERSMLKQYIKGKTSVNAKLTGILKTKVYVGIWP